MFKSLRVTLLLVLASLMAVSVSAQEGGILIGSTFGGDPNTINPLLGNSTVEDNYTDLLFPNIFNIDPETREPMMGGRNDQSNGLALEWTLSEDGMVYTFTLRDDIMWSDGTPVSAFDYKFTFDALASELTSSPRLDVLDTVASVEAPDATTLVITLTEASCLGLTKMDDFGILPQHIIEPLIDGDFAEIDNLDYNKNPEVTSGVFNFGALVPGEQVSMLRNDGYQLPVGLEGYIVRSVPDQVVEVEQFLAGELTSLGTGNGGVPQPRMQEFRERAEAGEFQIYEFVDDGLTFVGFNLADPTAPVDGLGEDGEALDQGVHPIFGDVRVRQAIAQAINYEDIIEGAAQGEGVQADAYGSPALWGYNTELDSWQYDPEAALALLAEAGWVDDDDDPSTPLVATEDALYAEPGTTLSFELATNSGNVVREATGTIFQDQLGQIGIEVDFVTQEFGALVTRLLGQEVDAILIGFTNIQPDTADGSGVFTPTGDTVGGGFNFVSYNNPRVTELYQQAATLPGCGFEERQALYWEIGEILHNDLPWLPLFAPNVMYAEANSVGNYDPFDEARYRNMADLAINP